MDAVKDIFDNISGFMLYVVPGYFFFAALNFAAYEKQEEQTEYFLIPCIAVSYVFSSFWASFIAPLTIPTNWPLWLIAALNFLKWASALLFPVLVGLVLGRTREAKWSNRLTGFFLGRTLSDNLFVELHENKTDRLLRVQLKDGSNIYYGQFDEVISPHENPILILKYCTICTEDETEVKDYSNDTIYRLIFPYSDILTLEIVPHLQPVDASRQT